MIGSKQDLSSKLKKLKPISRRLNQEGKRLLICGTRSGVGVTHLAILLATHAKRRGWRQVQLVEFNQHQDFQKIEQAYEGKGYQVKEAQPFRIKQVLYHPCVNEQVYRDLYNSRSGLIIGDMGPFNMQDCYYYSDKIILVGQGSDWRMEEVGERLRSIPMTLRHKLVVVVPFVTPKIAREIEHLVGQPTRSLGLACDPYLKYPQIYDLLDELLT